MQNLQKEIVELSNLSLKDGMGTDELVITLLSNAVVAASHLGLSKDFVLNEFDAAIEEVYREEEEGEECCENQTHQASPEMKLFFERLLHLKEHCQHKAKENKYCFDGPTWEEVFCRLDEIIKEKK